MIGSSSASSIHMVYHLIDTCLTFRMTKEECMEALTKHANIDSVITSTVWNELEKENKEFFEAYYTPSRCKDRMSESETSEVIQKIIAADQDTKNSDDK